MPVQFQLVGRNNRVVEVSPNGEVAVASLEYSTGKFNNMNVNDAAFNFHEPTAGKRFVVTGMIITTNRDVGVNGAVIEFYETSAVDSTVVDKTVSRFDMVKNQNIPISGINIILAEGSFLNGKTDDASALVTITGYEVDSF